jgi:hypothetical protein
MLFGDEGGNVRLRVISALLGLCVAWTVNAPAVEVAPLELVADVPLSGAAVRFDYQSLDVANNRLYIAHMNADQLVVFDTKNRSVIATLAGFPDVHGVIVVPELNRVYASATGDHKVYAVDAETWKIIAMAGPIHYPDGLAYAPGVKRVFVSDEHGNADAVVDASGPERVLTTAFAGRFTIVLVPFTRRMATVGLVSGNSFPVRTHRPLKARRKGHRVCVVAPSERLSFPKSPVVILGQNGMFWN